MGLIKVCQSCLEFSGSVFDVMKGKSHYCEGGGYNHFSGRDASRAFVSGNFTGDGLTDSLSGLSSQQVKSIVEWRDFYFRTYTFVGKLVGRYYDPKGNPTKYLKGVEAKAARGAQLLKKPEIEEAKQPSCNSGWIQDEGEEVQDATSGHEIRRESIGEGVHPHSTSDQEIEHAPVLTKSL